MRGEAPALRKEEDVAYGQFERGVGEVVGAKLVVIHSGINQGPFRHELLQECGVSLPFEHRSQP